MAITKALAMEAVKRTPLRSVIAGMARKRSWEVLSPEEIRCARSNIEKLHPRPVGHAYWDNRHTGTYRYDVSIIIPFYNTEKYARRCIDSVLNQKTTYSMEIILVDDGSPDGCGKILDSYAGCQGIVVFHKENGGLSDARNYGLQRANGEYILFIDSDDYCPQNAIQSLMEIAKAQCADIVEGSYSTFDDSNRVANYMHCFEVSNNGKKMFGYAWGKVYKASLFERFCFPKGFWFEDTIIGGLIFPAAKITVTIPNVVYQYYINQSGITSQANSNPRSIDTYYIFEELYDTLEHYGLKASRTIQNAVVWQLSKYVYGRCSHIGEQHMKELFVLCAELAEKYHVLSVERLQGYSFWEREVCEAFIHKQYGRWKLASIMM